jgi:hypothetical protein
MKVLSCVLLLLLASLCPAQTETPKPSTPVDKIHAASIHIFQRTLSGGGACSATAIGPHAILTATHCEEPTDALSIEDFDGDVTITARIRDGFDHSIYLLDGIVFEQYADVDLTNKLEAGEHVYFFGNPGKWSDIYREGYVAGFLIGGSIFDPHPPIALFDFQIFFGDSGSGIVSKDTNKIVAVISLVIVQDRSGASIQLAGAYALHFKQADIDRARAYVPPAPKG